MKLLLDTHIFLWYITGDPRLPASVLPFIRDPANEAYLSPVSVWETIVKYQLGKLPLPQSPEAYVRQQRQRHRIKSLPLDEASVTNLAQLPALHKDPFDRMLICQAIQHKLTLVSTDDAVRNYSAHISLIP
ncbi:type II toxin-antitoxin system VapC family toxin [Dehalococcoidia bacterium]|nr:type II toxin-antitoxin system VapC family toxin [Dehalococcoidia bacterium]MCL0058759.1 type II toxin-antitoxin system VapC family toxin [Dehalococcoidia bacterium]MCL0093642.1 type II toxin-antitoxin system VapC family toxin [Dehalococcoidia bacterium]